jgi:hypothetical protein
LMIGSSHSLVGHIDDIQGWTGVLPPIVGGGASQLTAAGPLLILSKGEACTV